MAITKHTKNEIDWIVRSETSIALFIPPRWILISVSNIYSHYFIELSLVCKVSLSQNLRTKKFRGQKAWNGCDLSHVTSRHPGISRTSMTPGSYGSHCLLRQVIYHTAGHYLLTVELANTFSTWMASKLVSVLGHSLVPREWHRGGIYFWGDSLPRYKTLIREHREF